MPPRDCDDRLQSLAIHAPARRVVRRGDQNYARVLTDEPFELVGIERPAVGFVAGPPRNARSDRLGDGVVRLIGGTVHDDVVAGAQRDVHKREERLFRAGVHQRVRGVDGVAVRRGDRGSQFRSAARLGIAEPHVRKTLASARFEVEQLGDRHRLRVARAKQMFGRKFVLCKVALEREILRLHVSSARSSRMNAPNRAAFASVEGIPACTTTT